MTKLTCLMLAAATFVLAACSKQDPPAAPPTDPNLVVAKVSQPYSSATPAQKKALRERLLEITREKSKSQPAPAAANIAFSWKDAVNKDLQVNYVRCVIPPKTDEGTFICHLETEAKNPIRYMRLGASGSDYAPFNASIRSEGSGDYMSCAEVNVDPEIKSVVSGDCVFRPHEEAGLHWFSAALLWSEKNKNFSSVYFVYLDKKPANEDEEDVHNGEGHAGDD